jgi:hypothetical protein
MRVRSFFLLVMFLSSLPCFGDLLLLSESSLAGYLDEQTQLEPKLGAMLGWDTYSFLSESFSLFLDSLSEIHYNTANERLDGEIYAALDISYRLDYFLVRLGVESTFISETDQEIYLDVVPELYFSYGTLEYTIFTSHTVSYLPVENLLEFYEARAGLTFGLDSMLNKPLIGVGVDLENGNYPLYLIAEYELSWYPDPLLSFEFIAGIHWFITVDEYQRYFTEMELLWYFSDGLILTVGLTSELINSGLYDQPEFKVEPEVELGITVTDNSIFYLGIEGTIYILESYLEEPSLLMFVARFSYLF